MIDNGCYNEVMRIRLEHGYSFNPETTIRARIVPEDPKLINLKPAPDEREEFLSLAREIHRRVQGKGLL